MEQFEYLRESIYSYDATEEHLNSLGEQGWELMHVMERGDSQRRMYHMLFKRRKQSQKHKI